MTNYGTQCQKLITESVRVKVERVTFILAFLGSLCPEAQRGNGDSILPALKFFKSRHREQLRLFIRRKILVGVERIKGDFSLSARRVIQLFDISVPIIFKPRIGSAGQVQRMIDLVF